MARDASTFTLKEHSMGLMARNLSHHFQSVSKNHQVYLKVLQFTSSWYRTPIFHPFWNNPSNDPSPRYSYLIQAEGQGFIQIYILALLSIGNAGALGYHLYMCRFVQNKTLELTS